MVEIHLTQRKTCVLNHPALPCLASGYAINLLSGCPYACRYCYAQSYASHPGWTAIRFYTNTLEKLSSELPRKRRRPQRVYFSTACEPFVPEPAILETLFGVMKLLLEHSVPLLISTKSRIPMRFVELFRKYPEKVHVQVGLTMADDAIRELLEPRAPSVADRLENLRTLIDNGIAAEVRADPIVPELTDTDENFTRLCAAVAETGGRRIIPSYLFLRRAVTQGLSQLRIGCWSFLEMADRIYTHELRNYCGQNTIRLPATSYRQARYARFRRIAADAGLTIGFCHCKNPDVTDDCCHPPLPATPSEPKQSLLFDTF